MGKFINVKIMPFSGNSDLIDVRWYPADGFQYPHFDSYADAMIASRGQRYTYPIMKEDYIPHMSSSHWNDLQKKYLSEVRGD